MGNFLKVFKTHEEYLEYLNSPNFKRPNVTRCVVSFKDNDVHYNPIQKVEWYDEEFKRIALNAFNNGEEMTFDDLNAITQERWDQVVHASNYSIFRGNTDIHSIADMEKFVNVHTLGNRTFENLTGVVGDLVIPSNITAVKNYVFNNMSGVTKLVIDHEITWTGAEDGWGPRTFGNLTGVNGIVDLRNFKNIGTYHEFDAFGRTGGGCKIIMPVLEQNFGVWFASSRVSALAGSEEELVDGTIKIPEGYTRGGQLAFNDDSLASRIICPESMTVFDAFAGGDESWNYVRYFEMGSNTTLLKGAVCGANGYQGRSTTVVCKAVTPPTVEIGGIGQTGNSNYGFPFISTRVGALYVPDESVELYKQSSTIVPKAAKQFDYYSTLEDDVEIGWKRFADVIHPLSELS